MKQLSESERMSILSGLKANWEDLYHQYQGLSVVIDTLPKKHRKERLESEMKQLERDIQMMEKHPTVYISNWNSRKKHSRRDKHGIESRC